jgi:acetoin utilization deacetylase AcuC-like enzyme
MYVVYTEEHRQHDPPFEIAEGGTRQPVYEVPERMDCITHALHKAGWAHFVEPGDFGLDPILAVHDADYVEFLRTGYDRWRQEAVALGEQIDPSVLLGVVWPARRATGRPKTAVGLAGYYAMDTCCPITAGTYAAALASAQVALTGAQLLHEGNHAVFALCRPPGHHAGRDFAGGYCYLNNASIAARYLSAHGAVSLLDVDFHAGNGTQDIFYSDPTVLTVDLHADPDRQYPYFTGYADERGAGSGLGFHRNITLPAGASDDLYLAALDEGLHIIRDAAPDMLVLSFGADIFGGDPIGDLVVTIGGFVEIGRRIAALGLPTLIVMEGGYNTQQLGTNTVAFLEAFAQGR